jgi:hypothetical protein
MGRVDQYCIVRLLKRRKGPCGVVPVALFHLVQVATAVRRYKSDRNLPLGTPIANLELRCPHPDLAEQLAAAVGDLRSITRAVRVDLVNEIDPEAEKILANDTLDAGIRIN